MSKKAVIPLALAGALAIAGLAGCGAQGDAKDFSGYKQVAELATIDCTYHNVAEIINDGANMLFGINETYKKAWFEYDGKVQLGIDAAKVKIDGPDANNVVTITVPKAQVLGTPEADESSFSDVYSETGFLASITAVDQTEAYATAQEEMKKSAEENDVILEHARERAKTLLSQYVSGIGERQGIKYEIKYLDAE